MSDLELLIDSTMAALCAKRPIFHSEADFQLAFSWELQSAHHDARIRLEKRVLDAPRVELDVFVGLEGRRYAIELKYPKSHLATTTADGEAYNLPEGTIDIALYDAIADVARCERIVSLGVAEAAATLILTNSRSAWAPVTARATIYDAFRLPDQHVLTGRLNWGTARAQDPRRRGQRSAYPAITS